MPVALLIATDLLFTAYHIHCQPLRPEGLKPQQFTAQESNYFTDIPQNIIFDSLQTQDGKLQKCWWWPEQVKTTYVWRELWWGDEVRQQ